MGKAFIIDTRESVFTIRESEVIEIVDMTLRCRVEGEVFNVKRGNYFATSNAIRNSTFTPPIVT